MAVFPYPPENMTGILGFLEYTNSLTNGFLGFGFLIIVFLVSFLSAKTYSYDRAFGFASFLTLISAILMRFLKLINDGILALSVILLVFSIILLSKERSSEGL